MFFYFKINQTFNLLCVFCEITANGKSIGEVREFEGQKVQEFRNVADAFSMK